MTLWADGDELRYRGPREALTADLVDNFKAHKPAILAALAHPGLPGISPEFAARLSAEDLEDIAAGDVSPGTVQAFEQAAIARETEDLKEFFEERSAILEVGLGRPNDVPVANRGSRRSLQIGTSCRPRPGPAGS